MSPVPKPPPPPKPPKPTSPKPTPAVPRPPRGRTAWWLVVIGFGLLLGSVASEVGLYLAALT